MRFQGLKGLHGNYVRHLWGTMPEACGEPHEVSARSSTRPRPGQARGPGRVTREATAGSSTRPWQLRRSLPGPLRGGCEGTSWEAFRAGMIVPQYNRQAPPTGDYSRRAALCEVVRRGLGQEASIGRRSRPSIRFMRSVVASTGRAMRSTQACRSMEPRPTRSRPARSSPADAAPVGRPRRCDR